MSFDAPQVWEPLRATDEYSRAVLVPQRHPGGGAACGPIF